MSFNDYGFQTIVNATYTLFDYLAYGNGTVVDNATSLDNELGRILASEQINYNNYFEVISTIDKNTGNGYDLTEFGLAVANTGDISSTQQYFPLIKTSSFEVIIYSTVIYSGLI